MHVDASGLHHLLSMALPSFWLQGGKEIASELFRNNPILYGEPLMSHVQGAERCTSGCKESEAARGLKQKQGLEPLPPPSTCGGQHVTVEKLMSGFSETKPGGHQVLGSGGLGQSLLFL